MAYAYGANIVNKDPHIHEPWRYTEMAIDIIQNKKNKKGQNKKKPYCIKGHVKEV